MLVLSHCPEIASLPQPLAHSASWCVTTSPLALLSWALYRGGLWLVYGHSKAVTTLPCRQRTSYIWGRDLPGLLVPAANKLLH